MGYACYEVGERWGGYGVPAICEHPGCNKKIDRGVSYACGGEPFSELGCDRYFCGEHRNYVTKRHDGHLVCVELCARCAKNKPPFPYKPETEERLDWMRTDESRAEWRENHPNHPYLLKSDAKKEPTTEKARTTKKVSREIKG